MVWSAVFVYLIIGFRLNYVLGGSVLTPKGGSKFWPVLTSPPQLAAILVASCCSVVLYAVLTEAEGRRLYQTEDFYSHSSSSLELRKYSSTQPPDSVRQESESLYSVTSSYQDTHPSISGTQPDSATQDSLSQTSSMVASSNNPSAPSSQKSWIHQPVPFPRANTPPDHHGSKERESGQLTPVRYNSSPDQNHRVIHQQPQRSSHYQSSSHLQNDPFLQSANFHNQEYITEGELSSSDLQRTLQQQMSSQSEAMHQKHYPTSRTNSPHMGASLATGQRSSWRGLSVTTARKDETMAVQQMDQRFAVYSKIPSFQRGPGDVSQLISSDSERSHSSSLNSRVSNDQLNKTFHSMPSWSRRNSSTELDQPQYLTPIASVVGHDASYFDSSHSSDGDGETSSSWEQEESDNRARPDNPFLDIDLSRSSGGGARRRRHRARQRSNSSHSILSLVQGTKHFPNIQGHSKYNSFSSAESDTEEENPLPPTHQARSVREGGAEEVSAPMPQGFTGASIMQNYNEITEKVKEREENPWVEYFDETSGSTYYYNEVTGDSSWEIPDEFYQKKVD